MTTKRTRRKLDGETIEGEREIRNNNEK